MKKLLTLDNLVNFCKNEKFYNFNAENSGYQLAVQVPSKFEISSDYKDDTLLFCNVKLFHIGENRNRSSVTKDAAVKSLSTIAYKPLLANFCEVDGVKDFTSHDMEIDEDGNIKYLEKQIGCFTSDSPEIRYDKIEDKEFVFARVAIPKEYTDACDIIERKNGTKVSVELLINEMSYSVDKQVLELTDITVSGATCLGKNPETGEDVNEGMKGARLDIEDFSNENNSIVGSFSKNGQDKLVEVLDKLNMTLSNLNNVNFTQKGGCSDMGHFEELLEKYSVTKEELDFDYGNMTDEELDAAFEKFVSNKKNYDYDEDVLYIDVEDDDEEDDYEDELDIDIEDIIDAINFESKKNCSFDKDGNMTMIFEVSHEDIRAALYNLIQIYEEEDNDWYYVLEVYDDYFIFENWNGTKLYKQTYTVDGDSVVLSGERQEMFKMILTESEKLSIEKMRDDYATLEAKYSELKSFKEEYDAAKIKSEKDAIFAREEYSILNDSEAFVELKKNAEKYSVEDIETKADVIFAKFVKKNGSFAVNGDNKNKSISLNFASHNDNKNKPYGNLFD